MTEGRGGGQGGGGGSCTLNTMLQTPIGRMLLQKEVLGPAAPYTRTQNEWQCGDMAMKLASSV